MRVWEGEVVVGLGLYGTNRLELYQSLEFPLIVYVQSVTEWRMGWGIPPLQRQGHGDLSGAPLRARESYQQILPAHLGRLGGARGVARQMHRVCWWVT